ncbi:MAG: aminoacyl-tRNA hydrolase [Alphaproteobacteria bacterium]|nr:aminoacyl-tRNA hydrolase [Alphaproteobacteria bacterium]
MLLLVGLGNPGPSYAGHRHNVGFMVIDAIARAYDFGPWRKKFHAELAEGTIAGTKVLAMKPQTYMNDSGRAVIEAVQFYKIPLSSLVVIHDELDLAPGKLKVKAGGGDAGHNGLRSITAALGPGYRRVRIGIGHPGAKELVQSYALHDFSKADQVWLAPLIEALVKTAPLLAKGDDMGVMNGIALLTQPARAAKETKPKES